MIRKTAKGYYVCVGGETIHLRADAPKVLERLPEILRANQDKLTFQDAAYVFDLYKKPSKSTRKKLEVVLRYWGKKKLASMHNIDMQTYLKQLEGMANNTQRTYANQVRTLYYYMCDMDLCERKHIRVSVKQERRSDHIDADKRDEMLAMLTGGTKALCQFMVYTGARYCEAIIVRDTDVVNDGRSVVLRNRKGDGEWHERTVPLHAKAQEAISWRKPHKDGWIFRTSQGRPWAATGQGFRNAMRDHGITPHMLRHTFGTMLGEQGTGIREIADLLGLANLDTARIYVNTEAESNRKHVDKL